ncbi:PapD-like protein [Fimicolochytrium jonesii]|uniref:PapD-like protein n=1 Tax=Fimicolochytrium jonesii TaxID=1396493 RepID=UPI0022FF336F|nr:PapD-like protein [Fimicolochytrium jonesii]KAI8817756.1 PapD-like protein [Fimicolochytrium jonesii]
MDAAAEPSLTVYPEKDLTFSPPFTTTVRRTLTVSNVHPTAAVAFKIKTTAPKQYCVRPNSGRIPAGGVVEVQVLLQPTKDDLSVTTKNRDKFLVQGIKVPSDVMTLEGDDLVARLADLWSQAESLKKTSPEAAAQVLIEKKLRCVFAPITSPGAGHAVIHEEEEIAVGRKETVFSNASANRVSSSDGELNAGVGTPAVSGRDVTTEFAEPTPSSQLPAAALPALPAQTPSAFPAHPQGQKPTTPPTGPISPPTPTPHPPKQALPEPDPALLHELHLGREKIKTLQAACEGYKQEIDRLNALRQRREITSSSSASRGPAAGGLAIAHTQAEQGMSAALVVAVAFVGFLLGVLFF